MKRVLVIILIIIVLSSCDSNKPYDAIIYTVITDHSDPEYDGSYRVHITLEDLKKMNSEFDVLEDLSICTVDKPEFGEPKRISISCNSIFNNYEPSDENISIFYTIPNLEPDSINGMANSDYYKKSQSHKRHVMYSDEIKKDIKLD